MLIIIIEHVCDIYAEKYIFMYKNNKQKSRNRKKKKNCYKIDMKQNMEP